MNPIMTTVTDAQLNCSYCNKTYKKKYTLDKHMIDCKFNYLTNKLINNEVEISQDKAPSLEGMYRLIRQMAIKEEKQNLRIEKLEQEIMKLSQIQKKKIKIVEWLNGSSENTLNTTFTQWIKETILVNVHLYLETVFETDLLTGILKLLENTIEKSQLNKLPIQCFDNKTNSFYIYKICINDSEECVKNWVHISSCELDSYLRIISDQFFVDFSNIWYTTNKLKIETDERYKDMYVDNYKKILGREGRLTDETRCDKIRERLYKVLKQNIQIINEYDIV